MKTYYEKNTMMVGRRIADEFILVPIRQKAADLQYMYTLNVVGARIWELIDGSGKTVDEIVSALTSEFEVEASQARPDVIEFLEQMKTIGAVVEKSEGGD